MDEGEALIAEAELEDEEEEGPSRPRLRGKLPLPLPLPLLLLREGSMAAWHNCWRKCSSSRSKRSQKGKDMIDDVVDFELHNHLLATLAGSTN